MRQDFRCDCPFTSALDVLGDKWILVIIKQMLIEGKETFKDFTESDEAIATNILSSKLQLLEEVGIIIKTKRPDNKKTSLYLLTEKGLALIPVLVELALWSDKNLRVQNAEMFSIAEAGFNQDKSKVTKGIQNNYRQLVQEILG